MIQPYVIKFEKWWIAFRPHLFSYYAVDSRGMSLEIVACHAEVLIYSI